jgi:hypothetical protein
VVPQWEALAAGGAGWEGGLKNGEAQEQGRWNASINETHNLNFLLVSNFYILNCCAT